METYKTITGTDKLNEFVKLGWKRIHTFTRVTEFTDAGTPAQSDAAFVILWDFPGEPEIPKRHQKLEPQEPVPS
jgi:hypothetical protein